MLTVVMGVTACGKTSVAKYLRTQLEQHHHLQGKKHPLAPVFLDADDYHSAAAKEKMSRGESLTDADREGWLVRLCQAIHDESLGQEPGDTERSGDTSHPHIFLACSALKERFRVLLQHAVPQSSPEHKTTFVFLDISEELATKWAAGRGAEHFASADIVPQQFVALERPTQEEAKEHGWNLLVFQFENQKQWDTEENSSLSENEKWGLYTKSIWMQWVQACGVSE